MKAEDTVIKDVPQGTEPQTTICRQCAYLSAQAEISFKAGIKEVVEAVRKCNACAPVATANGIHYVEIGLVDTWQAKLKEWGIEL